MPEITGWRVLVVILGLTALTFAVAWAIGLIAIFRYLYLQRDRGPIRETSWTGTVPTIRRSAPTAEQQVLKARAARALATCLASGAGSGGGYAHLRTPCSLRDSQ